MIHIVIAGDKNFKQYVDQGVRWNNKLGYETIVYDLGELGYGIPFQGRVSDRPSAKIPSKPAIILDAIKKIPDGDFLMWQDADALIYNRIDEIDDDYDIGVTVRLPKSVDHDLPINAGIIFFRKSEKVVEFIKKWKEISEQGDSDQPPLNQLCQVFNKDRGSTVQRGTLQIRVLPCEIYNNMYKKHLDKAKIRHFKTKRRWLYPLEDENGQLIEQ
jgi:hypothetical protein